MATLLVDSAPRRPGAVIGLMVALLGLLQAGCDPASPAGAGAAIVGEVACRAKPGKVDVTWEAFEGATGYVATRHVEGVGGRLAPVAVTVHADTPLENGRTYTYTVQALRDDGSETEPSLPCAATPAERDRTGGSPPTITSTPDGQGMAGLLYSHDVEASDPDGDPLAFSLPTAPPGMTIDPGSGVLQWAPDAADVGAHVVTIRVDDPDGKHDVLAYRLHVAPPDDPNRPPQITSAPIGEATAGIPYRYDVEASDPDVGDGLAFSLDAAPAGMSIDPVSGLIAWTPTAAQAGSNAVAVRVADPGGLSDTQGFAIEVEAGPSGPMITSQPATLLELTAEGGGALLLDLSIWDVIDIDTGFQGPADWVVHDPPTGVLQELNSDPSILLSQFEASEEQIEGRWRVHPEGEIDDDFIGFVFGYQDPQNFYLFDWKRGTQTTFGVLSEAGMSVKLVQADTPLGDALAYGAEPGASLWSTSGIGETAFDGDDRVRSLFHNDIPWEVNRDYVFTLDFRPGTFTITVRLDDITLDAITIEDDTFESGRFGFYNYSQNAVEYTGFRREIREVAEYVYDVEASDPDVGDVLLFSLTEAPAAMTIDPATGLIRWRTGRDDVGAHAVTVRVEDPTGLADEQSFLLEVVAVVPTITSDPITTARAGRLYVYDVAATDPQPGDVLTYSLDRPPAGMSIDPVSGLIGWTPEASDVGDHEISVIVEDPAGHATGQVYVLAVSPDNDPPLFTTAPIVSASQGVEYSYDADAIDPDFGDILTFSLASGPGGMSVDPATGLVRWTPQPEQLGTHPIVLEVRDPLGFVAVQSFALEARGTAPAIVSAPPEVGDLVPNGSYQYPLDVVDPDPADAISYSLEEGPFFLTVQADGLIRSLASSLPLGEFPVRVRATDRAGLFDEQTFTLRVAPDTVGPVVTLAADPQRAEPAEQVVVEITALDNSFRNVAATVTVDGVVTPFDVGVSIPPFITRTVTFNAPPTGVVEVVVTANDSAANVTTEQLFVPVNDPNDTTPPFAALESPDDLAEVTYLQDLIGTVRDDNFFRYQIGLALGNDQPFRLIAEGFQPVTSALLGTLDPTLLENGIHRVRLVAEDASGNTAIDERAVRITGDAKVGAFTLAFTDLQVPVSGLPITVERRYDSRVKTRHEFGVGWRLGLSRGRISTNRPVGAGWQVLPGGPLGFPCMNVVETASHLVEVRFSHHEEYVFAPSLSNPFPILGGCLVEIGFTLVSGSTTNATLEILDGSDGFYQTGGDEVVDPVTLTPRDPRRFRLSTADGHFFEFDRDAPGVTAIEDPNGNRLEIGSDGVVHSSGASISFERDLEGRIATIVDPLGNALHYAYDGAGDLVATTDRTGAVTTYEYDADHNLTEMVDPLGNRAVRTEYDAAGRVVRILDPDGSAVNLEHDLGARVERVVDRRGHAFTFLYDERGNVLEEIDPLGARTQQVFDERGNLLERTDPLGRTSLFSYDLDANLLSTTNPLGESVQRVFNASGRVTQFTDELGNTFGRVYDAFGQLERIEDPDGSERLLEYDASGNLTSITTALGETTFEHDANGNVIREVDPLGNETRHTVDESGRRTRTIRVRDGEELTWFFAYDAQDRLIEAIDPEGRRSTTSHDALGRVVSEIDGLGNETRIEYDARGLRTRVIHPDGTFELFAYDAERNLVSETDPAGRVTRHEYDALNRRTATFHPDATPSDPDDDPVERFEYDLAGQRIAEIDPLGHRTDHEYDAAGQRVRTLHPPVRDAVSGNIVRPETTFAYDAAGQHVATMDPLGATTVFEYGSIGLETGRLLPDGTRRELDRDPLGRIVRERDGLGNETTRLLDPLGRLLAVIDPLGGTTTHGYDALGGRVSQLDPNGNLTSLARDAAGRQTAIERPLGQTRTQSFDAAGRRASVTEFDGSTITFRYDARGRLLERSGPDGTTEFRYTPTGRIQSTVDARGTTLFAYDAQDRLLGRTEPDGRSITYRYDLRGDLSEAETPRGTVRYEHDALGRLVGVRDWDDLETRLGYDLAGRLVEVVRPNGTRSERSYDSLGRVLSIVERDGLGTVQLQLDYERDANGRVTGLEREDGSRTEYAYDALGRLVEERRLPPGSGTPDRVIGYVLDPVGNRLARSDSAEGDTDYLYDANDRLEQEDGPAGTRLYQHDARGNRVLEQAASTATAYRWDDAGRLVAIDLGNDGSEEIAYTLDAFGERARETRFGTETDFLLDTNREFSELALETAPDGSVRAAHVTGPVRIVSEIDGERRYFQTDGLGSVLGLTDAFGVQTDAYAYDAFGRREQASGTTANRFGFTGEPFDEASGLVDLRARSYDPSVGSFFSPDPFAGSADEPQSLHRYLYALADPVNRRDPSGRVPTSLAELQVVAAQVTSAAATTAVAYRAVGHRLLAATYRSIGAAYGQVVGNQVRGLSVGELRALAQRGSPASVRLFTLFRQSTNPMLRSVNPLICIAAVRGLQELGRDLRRRGDELAVVFEFLWNGRPERFCRNLRRANRAF